ncbi:alpha/beta-hydrolase [Cucurbitaria berberidis CBS 394.84]|uniref:Alpha/beta-hydrolase n=1 Tax=Cucurbitaria berberidis CBS 394.84 TaxID=1168544 RepID=A0A9P4GMN1_9PLEO|nr:alpha/beta-hydrolase [Cucurbitaria berberidis CBS 394.84]KAF1849228.1 alpha/beta-hydrolase [Cucurbitaria berberidis CBS 394.84]
MKLFTDLITLLLLLWDRVVVAGYGGEDQPRREFFYVGGEYANLTLGNTTAQFMINQIYVEKLTPPIVTQEHPIVFIHGSGQTATNFLETPDGRPGWASFFLSHGYVVYLSDQPARGRSPWHPSIGTMITLSTSDIEKAFTATSSHGLWPQSRLHTQWPGTGTVGDPIFDALYASQVQLQADELLSEAQNAKAYTALLDKIGPAYIITHSQSGPYGWRVGDLRSHLVKSIVALEPGGPPFIGRLPYIGPRRTWGITYHEITYEPSAGPNATHLETVTIPAKDEDRIECIMQVEPAKKLRNLAQVPVLVITGEASYHAPYDYCTVEYLRQAGVEVEYADLGQEGIHGNGHMLFMEKNNLVIAERVLRWLGSVHR